MFKFFKNKNSSEKTVNDDKLLSKTASLLIHAAKIDENYTNKEKLIVEKTLLELGANKEKLDELIKIAEENEKNSNQILGFTQDIKNTNENFKIKLVESLWKIIYSDEGSDMYESNLMRRLSGLLYLENKMVGDIKEKIKKNLNK